MTREIFTIGHSNHSAEEFTKLLIAHSVETVIDVRSQPYSRYAPHFNQAALRAILADISVGYHHASDLGGRPKNPDDYDAEGHVLYGNVAASGDFRRALGELKATAGASRAAIMCGEEDPSECHRRLLVGRMLLDEGWKITHIRGDGSSQTESELSAIRGPAGQEGLFEGGEFSAWRSTQSVSRRSQPQSSSGS